MDLIDRQAAIEVVKHAWAKGLEPTQYLEELPAVQTCEDAVSRQDAIDALKGLPTWWADEGGYYGGAQPPMVALLDPEDAVSAIENLPAAQSHDIARDIATIIENEKDMRVILKNAQPDAPDTNGGDIIYRQAAIDKLDPLFESLAIDKIKALPTAQDVIRCKDCRFQDKGSNESESWNLCGYRPWLHVPTEDEHYCGYAKRRTE